MRYLLPLLLLLGGCGGCVSVTQSDMRATTLRMEFATGLCSGTAIGPDTILTAKHCLSHPLKMVEGVQAEVIGSKLETRDTIVIKVKGVRFKHWAKRGPRPNQGDHLTFWGNPEGVPDVMREVLVSRAWTDGLVLQATVCPGDSGAGLFNARGEVVGIVSAVTGDRVCKFGLSL